MLKILWKETREALRDRNLIVQLVLIPLFLYPLLGLGAWQVFMLLQGADEGKVDRVWIAADSPPEWGEVLRGLGDIELEAHADAATGPSVQASFASGHPVALAISPAVGDSLRIFFNGASERSRALLSRFESALQARTDSLRREAALSGGFSPAGYEQLHVVIHDQASARQRGRAILALILPAILLLMLGQGCTWATLDTIVGERERGTWETLLSSPLGRGEIVAGKLAVVIGWSMLAFLLNLLGMVVFLRFALGLLGGGDALDLGLDLPALLVLFSGALLAAGLLGALMVLVALPCKSYREAQASLGPLLLLIVFVPMAALQAVDEFSMGLALIPFVNVAALMREAIRGDFPVGPLLICLVEMSLLAGLALGMASRILGREDALLDARFRWKFPWDKKDVA